MWWSQENVPVQNHNQNTYDGVDMIRCLFLKCTDGHRQSATIRHRSQAWSTQVRRGFLRESSFPPGRRRPLPFPRGGVKKLLRRETAFKTCAMVFDMIPFCLNRADGHWQSATLSYINICHRSQSWSTSVLGVPPRVTPPTPTPAPRPALPPCGGSKKMFRGKTALSRFKTALSRFIL